MSVYTNLVDPTTIDHATSACITARDRLELAVVRGNVLQLYRIVEREEDLTQGEGEAQENGADNVVAQSDDFLGAELRITTTQKQVVGRLILHSEHVLYGRVTGLEAIAAEDFEATGRHHLLLTFATAKASLLRWDQDAHDLVTISMHAFERDTFHSPLVDAAEARLRVDPLSRVATLQCYGKQMAFMPIAQRDDLVMDGSDVKSDLSTALISGSFVLDASQLEEDVSNLIDFAYLDGYQEPTIALLYNKESATSSLSTWRKDTTRLVCLSLDLQAGARTVIYEVERLPMTLSRVFPMPDPIRGSLLIGANEIIYVDPASRTIGVAVNRYARMTSDIEMLDQASLELRLEGAHATPLLDGQAFAGVLLNLADGSAATIRFSIEGRSVSRMVVEPVLDPASISALPVVVTRSVQAGERRLLLTSRTGDTHLVSWRKKRRQAQRDEHADVVQQADGAGEADDLQDLYGDAVDDAGAGSSDGFDIVFVLNDVLSNPGPVASMTIAREQRRPDVWSKQKDHDTTVELVTAGGYGRMGNVTIRHRHIRPQVVGKFDSPEWRALWSIRLRALETKGDAESAMQDVYDTYLIASQASNSQVFSLERDFVEITHSEFETGDPTVAAGVLADRSCLVQVCTDMMRTYDADLKLMQLIATPEDSMVVAASICDPFVLLLLDNGQTVAYKVNARTKDLVEVPNKHKSEVKVVWASLSEPSEASPLRSLLATMQPPARGKKRTRKDMEQGDVADGAAGRVDDRVCLTLTADSRLVLSSVVTGAEIWSCDHLNELHGRLGTSLAKAAASDDVRGVELTIEEALLVELGDHDETLTPYLVLRTSKDDIAIYEAYLDSSNKICFARSDALTPTRGTLADKTDISHPANRGKMSAIKVDGRSCVFIRGAQPYWLIKTEKSMPKLHPTLNRSIVGISSFNTFEAPLGFITSDAAGVVQICRMPQDFSFDGDWLAKTVRIGRTVHSVQYYAKHHLLAVVTSEDSTFEVPDEEDLEWQASTEDRERLPRFARGAIELFDADTHEQVDGFEFAHNEHVLAMKAVSLNVSGERNRQARDLIACTTGIFRGEDLAIRGGLFLLDVVEVVPEPSRPNSRYRLKFVCNEELRSTCTVVNDVEGYLISSQGQKIVIRSLEEDERLTPVAFIDLGVYTAVAKSLRSTILFGDVLQGLTFVGFGEEPYKLTPFGKSFDPIEVVDAEYMVNGRQLYLCASDNDGNIKLMQYDPEHPDTFAGARLLRKADMHVGAVVTQMQLIPSRPSLSGSTFDHAPNGDAETGTGTGPGTGTTAVLCATADGAIGMLSPLGERVFRRLYTMQAQLHSGAGDVVYTANLNPRAHRACTVDSPTCNNVKGILDGDLLLRHCLPGAGGRADHLDRPANGDAQEIGGLDVRKIENMARRAGTAADEIVKDLTGLFAPLALF